MRTSTVPLAAVLLTTSTLISATSTLSSSDPSAISSAPSTSYTDGSEDDGPDPVTQIAALATADPTAASAFASWASAQAADIAAQNSDYLNAVVPALTGTAAPELPSYISQVPESLKGYVSSVLNGEKAIVTSDFGPIEDSSTASGMSATGVTSGGSATTTVESKGAAKGTGKGGVASSGLPSLSSNGTGGVSKPSSPPKPSQSGKSSGAVAFAGREGSTVWMIGGAAALGVAGIMVLL